MVKVQPRVRRERKTPIYNIGAAARLTGLPAWTLRWVESHDLVFPRRTGGNQRLFSDQDIDLLGQIRDLLEEGVNLQGVRVILKMRMSYGAMGRSEGRFQPKEARQNIKIRRKLTWRKK